MDQYTADVVVHCSDPPSEIKDLFPELLGVLLEADLIHQLCPCRAPALGIAHASSSKVTPQGYNFLGQSASQD